MNAKHLHASDTALMDAFHGYVEIINLQSADNLVVHTADTGHVAVIEYEVYGTVLATGTKYDNRFCSIIHLENRKIAHWRDYSRTGPRNARTGEHTGFGPVE